MQLLLCRECKAMDVSSKIFGKPQGQLSSLYDEMISGKVERIINDPYYPLFHVSELHPQISTADQRRQRETSIMLSMR